MLIRPYLKLLSANPIRITIKVNEKTNPVIRPMEFCWFKYENITGMPAKPSVLYGPIFEFIHLIISSLIFTTSDAVA